MRLSIAFGLVALAALASCMEVTVVGTHRDAISRNDTAQIKRLVSQRRDLPCDVLTVRPLSANTAAAESWGGFGYHTFTVRKTQGEWKIDAATIQRHMILH
jgi:hypothetical protein